jgi:hypothetical protein
VRGRVAPRPWRGHRQRPGQPPHAVLSRVHRRREALRRSGREPGRPEPHQHNFRWVLLVVLPSIDFSSCSSHFFFGVQWCFQTSAKHKDGVFHVCPRSQIDVHSVVA